MWTREKKERKQDSFYKSAAPPLQTAKRSWLNDVIVEYLWGSIFFSRLFMLCSVTRVQLEWWPVTRDFFHLHSFDGLLLGICKAERREEWKVFFLLSSHDVTEINYSYRLALGVIEFASEHLTPVAELEQQQQHKNVSHAPNQHSSARPPFSCYFSRSNCRSQLSTHHKSVWHSKEREKTCCLTCKLKRN